MTDQAERRRPFAEELREFGPESHSEPMSLPAAEAYCRKLARSHYENFPLVSWLLPKELHQHFYNVYAFCRWADDLGDEVHDPVRSLALLEWWRAQVSLCHEAAANLQDGSRQALRHPVMIALHTTIREFQIPLQPFVDLISAFIQDQTRTSYETFEELLDYCRRSANPVGRLVLHLGRDVNVVNLGWSDSICTGLQLANFWQDVARDFTIGRIYLPVRDLEQFGVDRDVLGQGVSTPEFKRLMAFQVDRTRKFFNDGSPLVDNVTPALRLDVDLFLAGGRKILDRIETSGFQVLERRPKVTKWDAVGLLAGACWRKWTSPRRSVGAI